jgi:hypothetical protein
MKDTLREISIADDDELNKFIFSKQFQRDEWIKNKLESIIFSEIISTIKNTSTSESDLETELRSDLNSILSESLEDFDLQSNLIQENLPFVEHQEKEVAIDSNQDQIKNIELVSNIVPTSDIKIITSLKNRKRKPVNDLQIQRVPKKIIPNRKQSDIPIPFPSPNSVGSFKNLTIPRGNWYDLKNILGNQFQHYQIQCMYEEKTIEKWYFKINSEKKQLSTAIIGSLASSNNFRIDTFHCCDVKAAGYVLSAICLFWLSDEAQTLIGQKRLKEIEYISYEPCNETEEKPVKDYFINKLFKENSFFRKGIGNYNFELFT